MSSVLPPVALLFNGDGVFEATRLVQHGYDSAVSDFGLASRQASVTDGPSADAALRTLSGEGTALIVVTAVDTNLDAVARARRSGHGGRGSSAEHSSSPSIPPDRVAQAQSLGLGPSACGG
jgi:hypothetical protein